MTTYNDDIHKCMCGSGLHKYALYDARGIFCTYVCDKCEDSKAARYRPEIFTDSNYYCEEQIEFDY
jgi:hypothetical protein